MSASRPASIVAGLLVAATLGCRAAAPGPSTPRTIAILVGDSLGYQPARIEVVAGVPLRLAFHSQAESDCMRQVVSDDLGLPLTTLPKGETTIVEITPQVPGTFAFTCGMGMVSGTVLVQDA